MRTHVARPCGDDVHELAEGPVWDDVTGTLSWVDIEAGAVLRGRLDDATVRVTDRYEFPATVGAAVPTADGGLLVAAHDRLVTVAADGVRREGPSLLGGDAAMRLNDGGCDPVGRFLVGTLALDDRVGAASLLRLEADGTTTVLRSGLTLSNGLGWSPSGDTVYLVDSIPGSVWSAPYDVVTGDVGGWTLVRDEFDGLPDGLCVDAQGRLWVAIMGGSQVCCYAPTGEPLAAVDLPVPHVSCAAFVGPDLDRLLVTTARNDLDDEGRLRHPAAGRLFLADVDATGRPTRRWEGTAAHPPWAAATP